MKLLALLLLTGLLHAEEPKPPTPEQPVVAKPVATPQEVIEILNLMIATLRTENDKLNTLMLYFQGQPSPAAAALAIRQAELDKKYGCKVDNEGKCPVPAKPEAAATP